MCEGFSRDDVLALDAASIAEYGFAIIAVGPPDDAHEKGGSWAYTVGLLDAADHPELIVTGVGAETAGMLLKSLADEVLAGEQYCVGDTIRTPRGAARVGPVHEVQYGLETFDMWHNQRRYGTLGTRELEAVQIVLPSAFFCSVHRHAQPVLGDPTARVGRRERPSNRAERRRRRH
jgi:hypothetical protein